MTAMTATSSMVPFMSHRLEEQLWHLEAVLAHVHLLTIRQLMDNKNEKGGAAGGGRTLWVQRGRMGRGMDFEKTGHSYSSSPKNAHRKRLAENNPPSLSQ
jgi:hypothetical protein